MIGCTRITFTFLRSCLGCARNDYPSKTTKVMRSPKYVPWAAPAKQLTSTCDQCCTRITFTIPRNLLGCARNDYPYRKITSHQGFSISCSCCKELEVRLRDANVLSVPALFEGIPWRELTLVSVKLVVQGAIRSVASLHFLACAFPRAMARQQPLQPRFSLSISQPASVA